MPDFKLKRPTIGLQQSNYLNLRVTSNIRWTKYFDATAHNSWHAIYAQLTGGNTTRGFTFAFKTWYQLEIIVLF